MEAWVDVAFATNAKDRDGGLVVRSAAGPSLVLAPGMEVAFAPPVIDAPRRATVSELRPLSDTSALVRFDAVDSAVRARMLVGCHVLVREADLEEARRAGESAFVEGFAVVDEREGEVGTVSRLIENPGQALLEVERADGRPALVPFVDGIVIDVDEEARRIDICAPQGLFEL